MSDRDDLPTLRAAAEARQPGPYTVSIGLEPRINGADGTSIARAWTIEDLPVLAYLVASANAAPGLAAEVERLRRDCARLEDERLRKEQEGLAEVARLTKERDRLRGLLRDCAHVAEWALNNVEGYTDDEEAKLARIRREGGLTDGE